MASLYEMFETNSSFETGGIVIDYGAAGRFKVARAGGANKKYARILEAKMRPYRRQAELGMLDEGVAVRVLAEAFAEAVVMNWEDVTDSAGEEIPYSYANCVKLLTDLPEFFADLREQCSKIANFQSKTQEADAKN